MHGMAPPTAGVSSHVSIINIIPHRHIWRLIPKQTLSSKQLTLTITISILTHCHSMTQSQETDHFKIRRRVEVNSSLGIGSDLFSLKSAKPLQIGVRVAMKAPRR